MNERPIIDWEEQALKKSGANNVSISSFDRRYNRGSFIVRPEKATKSFKDIKNQTKSTNLADKKSAPILPCEDDFS
ncbi:hypothetical protein GCM10011352_01300 [Marinobacterium zhoushanense]|uniref:Uncharacterized protein n=1 Tax=Marinobacterium zhoushanense TaxID=1679163 RepID=A0ABQ1JZZ5_9GAMM|nr:hypothetical protein GCM10011352_01300 [Marinobacterium zhoushanense]